MNTVEIKALLPGSGKTTTLINFFKKSNLDNKIILTPSNKARQVCIQKLMTVCKIPYEEACKYVKTLKSFKRNYVQVLLKEDDDSETYVTVESKDHITLKPYNIFIDEASMISDWEMQDLIKHFRIQNLILDGDSLQFEPIGGKQAIVNANNEVQRTVEGSLLFNEDTGSPYKLTINHQILLNKQMRASDPELQNAIKLIKQGNLIDAICYILEKNPPKACENLYTDQHIAYTNNLCDKLNKMYTLPKKFIVAKDDKMHGFYTSEILRDDDKRFSVLEQNLMYESITSEKKIPSFAEWKLKHLKPAYAITSHKLQGSTIDSGDIYIHVNDILTGLQDVLDENERAKLFQKFLYIAVSRATSIKQVNLYGCCNIDLLQILIQGNQYNEGLKTDKFSEYYGEVVQEIAKLDGLVTELIDDTIEEDAIQFAADDENLLDYLEGCLNYEIEEDELYLKYKKEHYNEEFSKAQKGKHSKPHKPHNYDPQMIEDAKNMTGRAWCEKYNKSNTLYRKLKA